MTSTPAEMNGAESLVHTLAASGVSMCFANPGTSEMHFVAALDRIPGVRCVLGLFEGVVTGAADGYYRMAGQPAATLLHLGPGLGNGLGGGVHLAGRLHKVALAFVEGDLVDLFLGRVAGHHGHKRQTEEAREIRLAHGGGPAGGFDHRGAFVQPAVAQRIEEERGYRGGYPDAEPGDHERE